MKKRIKKLADTTNGYYIHKTAKVGTTYTYTVRGLSNNKKKFITNYYTVNNTHKRIRPEIRYTRFTFDKKVRNMGGNHYCIGTISLSFDKACNNAKYQIYIRDINKRWQLIQTTAVQKDISRSSNGSAPGYYNSYTVSRCNNRYYLNYSGKRIELPTPATKAAKKNGLYYSDIRAWKFTVRALDNKNKALTTNYPQANKTYIN